MGRCGLRMKGQGWTSSSTAIATENSLMSSFLGDTFTLLDLQL